MADDSLDIPREARVAIFERDKGFCRMCGEFKGDGWYDIHHAIFGGDARGMGGRRIHNIDEMLSLCRPCHSRAHSRKLYWQPILLAVIQRPGVTAFQLARWARTREARERRAQSRRVG